MNSKPYTTKYASRVLTQGWKLKSASEVGETGDLVSTRASILDDGLPAQVPTTVLAALVNNGVYDRPYYADNLKNIPTDPFKVPWWYLTTFELTEVQAPLFAHLNFDGINYKANVWLNGHQVADSNTINGAYRRTAFDISTYTKEGENILAIEVIPPKPGDFSIGFVDWNPAPPDGNMGVFRPVTLELHGGVLVKNPFVRSHIRHEPEPEADLFISAELTNFHDRPIAGDLLVEIGDIRFEVPLNLPSKAKSTIEIGPDDHPELRIRNPRLWWPVGMGEPHLYPLKLTFAARQEVWSCAETRFGIREVTDYWLNEIHRGFRINGQNVLIKGAGWTDDLLLMDTHDKIEAQVNYVRHMNLNCIRLEGFWGTDQKLYDLCDEQGILLMAGWSCHWEHEIHMGVPVDERFGGVYKPDDIALVAQAWEDQVLWLRNHPSIFVWTVASDKVPITELERKYIETFAKYDPTRPYLNSTGGVGSDQHVIGSEDVISEISGSSGVKMLGPYAYTAPVYWFTDTRFGGAYGFNTETGPGAQVPQLDSLKRFIPDDELWPIGDVWNYHCGRYEFSDLGRFVTAINERYGTPSSIEDFDKKAQAMNYELMRPMFEAFQVNKSKATGVVQWMLNAAWPKMYWQLYDYYLLPTGAFYATRKACAPLQLIYNYGDHKVYAVNDHLRSIDNLHAHIKVFDINSDLLFSEHREFHAPPDSSTPLLEVKVPDAISSSYFLDLRLYDDKGTSVSDNFYWLSTQEEVLDYDADLGEFAFHTPSKQYANLKELGSLRTVDLSVGFRTLTENGQRHAEAILHNDNDRIAFLINLKLLDKETGEPFVPVFWEDNFISLLPGEKRRVRTSLHQGGPVELKVEGWNVAPVTYKDSNTTT
ncbi:glycoside hydrolase family 2 [Pseudozobellia thermophila]|uniref:Exo-1,4-beta-D-glucosaminidase n=1 Tax=Pseudozobellia thermophila TaxID=192903 RepID=A0A1M6I360_9FLAO|nr:glycoside hydrolase family 2 [Pseudozobellia thermophila]SHJ28911.1 exo-1,4-beta-D-glucosaminidase [Pseudozobellia thermophila]